MSLTFALAAAVNGSTGPRAILIDGLVRTKQPRRRSGQHQRRGFSPRRGGRARAAGNTHREIAGSPRVAGPPPTQPTGMLLVSCLGFTRFG
jgi:hypothetical protein